MAEQTQNEPAMVIELRLNDEPLGCVRNGAIEPLDCFADTDCVLFFGLRELMRAA
jgi:hypothetical protein